MQEIYTADPNKGKILQLAKIAGAAICGVAATAVAAHFVFLPIAGLFAFSASALFAAKIVAGGASCAAGAVTGMVAAAALKTKTGILQHNL